LTVSYSALFLRQIQIRMDSAQMKKAINEISRGVLWDDSTIPKTPQNKADWDALIRDMDHDLRLVNF